MARETWIERNSHYQAVGDVDDEGKMTGAEITDNNGLTKDRNRTFESQRDFAQWARNASGTNW